MDLPLRTLDRSSTAQGLESGKESEHETSEQQSVTKASRNSGDSDVSITRRGLQHEIEVVKAQHFKRQSIRQSSSQLPPPLDGPVDVEKADTSSNNTKGLDWDSPNDPGNPMNWPKWSRYWHVVPAALISFSA